MFVVISFIAEANYKIGLSWVLESNKPNAAVSFTVAANVMRQLLARANAANASSSTNNTSTSTNNSNNTSTSNNSTSSTASTATTSATTSVAVNAADDDNLTSDDIRNLTLALEDVEAKVIDENE